MATGKKVWVAVAVRVLQGHCLDVLAGLEAQSVHMVCTSPPFWKLRAYGTEPQVWDGDPACEHDWTEHRIGRATRHGAAVAQGLEGGNAYGNHVLPDRTRTSTVCARCGAWRGELGQEETPEAFVSHLVAVFRAVRRVLRDDGVAFVNLGDSYWSDPGGQNGTTGNVSARAITANTQAGRQDRTSQKHDRLKPGDLVGIPWAFAFAMQEAGWVLRSAVTWVKLSPMPESIQGTRWERCRVRVGGGLKDLGRHGGEANAFRGDAGAQGAHVGGTGPVIDGSAEWADCPGCPRCAENEGLVLRRGSGRPTNACEMLFVFVKKMGAYFYDLESTRVAGSLNSHGGTPTSVGPKLGPVRGDGGVNTMGVPAGDGGRNAWNWMTFGGKGAQLKEAHYAAYPPQLPEFCISAGSSQAGVCPTCAAPWARVVERSYTPTEKVRGRGAKANGPEGHAGSNWAPYPDLALNTQILSWRPTCAHRDLEPIPARVLDPFFGSGTTGMVADRLGRDCTGIDIKPEYAAMSQRRIVGDAPLFAEVTLEGAAAG